MIGEGQPVHGGTESDSEAAAPPAGVRPVDDPRALQILSTEHWSLLTARSLAYNEAFTRAGMFLTFLSATLIVIGLMAASDAFGEAVLPVTALLLAVDLFIEMAMVGRLANASSEEFRAIRGMNRIRHAYSEMVPGIERYFVTSIHDDDRGALSNFGDPDDAPWLGTLHGLTTAIGMLVIIVCVLCAALIAVIAAGIGGSEGVAIGIGVVSFLLLFTLSIVLGAKAATAVVEEPEAMFPTPPTARRKA
jgi:hypothetical protein